MNRYQWEVFEVNEDFVNAADLNRWGGESIDHEREDIYTEHWEMFDGDGVMYARGIIWGPDYTGFEPLDDWGRSLGCTTIHIDGEEL